MIRMEEVGFLSLAGGCVPAGPTSTAISCGPKGNGITQARCRRHIRCLLPLWRTAPSAVPPDTHLMILAGQKNGDVREAAVRALVAIGPHSRTAGREPVSA